MLAVAAHQLRWPSATRPIPRRQWAGARCPHGGGRQSAGSVAQPQLRDIRAQLAVVAIAGMPSAVARAGESRALHPLVTRRPKGQYGRSGTMVRMSKAGRQSCRPIRCCLQRHGISRLPEVAGAKLQKKKFKVYPIGFFHIDIAEVQTAEGKLYLYVAIDRTSNGEKGRTDVGLRLPRGPDRGCPL